MTMKKPKKKKKDGKKKKKTDIGTVKIYLEEKVTYH